MKQVASLLKWVKKHTQGLAIACGMVGGGFYGVHQMELVGQEHQIDAQWLEHQYLNDKRMFARNCLHESRGNAGKGAQLSSEAIEACENLATSLFPPKDFYKIAMLNWERQQLGVVLYEEDPSK